MYIVERVRSDLPIGRVLGDIIHLIKVFVSVLLLLVYRIVQSTHTLTRISPSAGLGTSVSWTATLWSSWVISAFIFAIFDRMGA